MNWKNIFKNHVFGFQTLDYNIRLLGMCNRKRTGADYGSVELEMELEHIGHVKDWDTRDELGTSFDHVSVFVKCAGYEFYRSTLPLCWKQPIGHWRTYRVSVQPVEPKPFSDFTDKRFLTLLSGLGKRTRYYGY